MWGPVGGSFGAAARWREKKASWYSDKLSEIIAVGALLFIRATAAQSARSEDHDEEDAYLLARGSDDRRRLGHDDDGCIRPVAGTGWRLARRMEGWRMGTRSCGRVVGGAVIAGAIIASRPQGYVVYPSYAQPVYGPGCYWASQPVYDGLGRVVGYTGRPVQVCPGYVPPPPPAPGYAGPPPAPPATVELPPK